MRAYRRDLTFDEVAAVLAYDPLTGVLTFRHASKRSPAGRPAGRRDKKGYLRTRMGLGEYKNHRLAWLLYYGAWPTQEIDHINGKTADNRIENLRDVSFSTNGLNRVRAMSNNRLGVLGVHSTGNGFVAQLKVGPNRFRSPLLASIKEAEAMYANWKQTFATAK